MNPHLQPWAVSADDYPGDSFTSDQLSFLLGYAVLAPSNHNTQPWLFRVNVSNVELFADRRRALRVVDPCDRELTLSCGAALFNLRTAAEYFGHAYEVELAPDPTQANLLARFYLRLSTETSSEDVLLFNAIQSRRTNREPFREDPVSQEILGELADAAAREGAWFEVLDDDSRRVTAAELVALGDRAQWRSPEFRKELAKWVRPDAGHHADGIPTRDYGVHDWLSFAGPALIRSFNRGNNQAARDTDIALHSPALAVLGTDRENVRGWMEAGQALQSVLLHAQSEGVAASFLNQPLEVEDLRPQLGDLTGRDGFPQVLLRLGYPTVEPPPSPRRAVRTVLLQHQHEVQH
ncbi:MAG: Acg family FMN-binding oxidoreductase [Limisphaerales bacterium]